MILEEKLSEKLEIVREVKLRENKGLDPTRIGNRERKQAVIQLLIHN